MVAARSDMPHGGLVLGLGPSAPARGPNALPDSREDWNRWTQGFGLWHGCKDSLWHFTSQCNVHHAHACALILLLNMASHTLVYPRTLYSKTALHFGCLNGFP